MRICFPKGFYSGGDGHASPDQRQPQAWIGLCNLARLYNKPVIANGDMFDLVIWGWERYWGSVAIQSFMQSVHGLKCYVVVGNHEGKIKWVKSLFQSCPNIHVVTELDINVGGHKWHIEHGDRYALDWGHIGWLYRAVAYFFLSFAPHLWLRLMKPWMPGAMKPSKGTESEKYTNLTGRIWDRAFKHAYKNNTGVIIGHTHTALETSGLVSMIDDGDLRDGSAAVVDASGDGRVIWLGGNK